MVGLDSGAENHIFLLNRGTSIRLKTAISFQCVCVCVNTIIYRYVWGFFKYCFSTCLNCIYQT